MAGFTLNFHDYPRAHSAPLPDITLTPLEVEHTPDMHLLEWQGTGLCIMITPDRLRELAALILNKFPLIAPALADPLPVELASEDGEIPTHLCVDGYGERRGDDVEVFF